MGSIKRINGGDDYLDEFIKDYRAGRITAAAIVYELDDEPCYRVLVEQDTMVYIGLLWATLFAITVEPLLEDNNIVN